MSESITVCGLSVTPIKSLRVQAVDAIELTPDGARDDRRFLVIDERGRLLNGKACGGLQTVVASYQSDGRTDGRGAGGGGGAGSLELRFPDGVEVRAPVAHGATVDFRFFSEARSGRVLAGPWSAALSDHLGREVRVVEPEAAGPDRGLEGSVSVISRASLQRLASEAGEPSVDARRFRMLIEIDGVPAHAEDTWVDRRIRIGSAEVRFHGHVGRCLTTSRDPESGEPTLPTLELLRTYRGELDTTEPLPFGIYGEVTVPGVVRLGDAVTPAAE